MVTDRFGTILEELGTIMSLKLAPDKLNSCLIRLPNKLQLVLRSSSSEEELIALIEIGQPGIGPFRLNILKEALMANAQNEAKAGIFCYGIKKDELVLYQSIPIFDLTGRQLFDTITELCQTAQYWKDCITRGELPQRYAPAISENIFGLKGTT